MIILSFLFFCLFYWFVVVTYLYCECGSSYCSLRVFCFLLHSRNTIFYTPGTSLVHKKETREVIWPTCVLVGQHPQICCSSPSLSTVFYCYEVHLSSYHCLLSECWTSIAQYFYNINVRDILMLRWMCHFKDCRWWGIITSNKKVILAQQMIK